MSYRKVKQRGNTGKQLKHKRFAVQYVKLSAGKLNCLAKLWVTFIVSIHLRKEKKTFRIIYIIYLSSIFSDTGNHHSFI